MGRLPPRGDSQRDCCRLSRASGAADKPWCSSSCGTVTASAFIDSKWIPTHCRCCQVTVPRLRTHMPRARDPAGICLQLSECRGVPGSVLAERGTFPPGITGESQCFGAQALREPKKSVAHLQLGTRRHFMRHRFAASAGVTVRTPLCGRQHNLSGAAQTEAAGATASRAAQSRG